MSFKIKESFDLLASPIYRARGRRTWSPGYFTAKKGAIGASIDNHVLQQDKELPSGYG